MQLFMPYLAGCFLAKRSVLLWQNEAVFALSGVQGDFPSASQFSQVSLGELAGIEPMLS